MTTPAHPGRTLFVNLPVADLARSKAFFAELGFRFNPMFSDETAACMLVGEHAFVMLLGREKFAEFSKLPIADPTTHALALYCFSVVVPRRGRHGRAAALAAGGPEADGAEDHGFMYSRSFFDLDGHGWQVMWMDPAAARRAPRRPSRGKCDAGHCWERWRWGCCSRRRRRRAPPWSRRCRRAQGFDSIAATSTGAVSASHRTEPGGMARHRVADAERVRLEIGPHEGGHVQRGPRPPRRAWRYGVLVGGNAACTRTRTAPSRGSRSSPVPARSWAPRRSRPTARYPRGCGSVDDRPPWLQLHVTTRRYKSTAGTRRTASWTRSPRHRTAACGSGGSAATTCCASPGQCDLLLRPALDDANVAALASARRHGLREGVAARASPPQVTPAGQVVDVGEPDTAGFDLAAAPDGTAWLNNPESCSMLHLAGTTTTSLRAPIAPVASAVGPDGTLWLASRSQMLHLAPAELTSTAPCDTTNPRACGGGSRTAR